MPHDRFLRPCCGRDLCPRGELSSLLETGDLIPDRDRRAACIVAELCGKFPEAILWQCCSRLFEAPPECRLCDEFVITYQIERDAFEDNGRIAEA